VQLLRVRISFIVIVMTATQRQIMSLQTLFATISAEQPRTIRLNMDLIPIITSVRRGLIRGFLGRTACSGYGARL
jgi:hypothetical protein